MNKTLEERALFLIEMAKIAELEKAGSSSYIRWQNIKRGRARIGGDEIEILGKVFPEYRWWLMTGEENPEIEQISPELEETRKNYKQTGTATE